MREWNSQMSLYIVWEEIFLLFFFVCSKAEVCFFICHFIFISPANWQTERDLAKFPEGRSMDTGPTMATDKFSCSKWHAEVKMLGNNSLVFCPDRILKKAVVNGFSCLSADFRFRERKMDEKKLILNCCAVHSCVIITPNFIFSVFRVHRIITLWLPNVHWNTHTQFILVLSCCLLLIKWTIKLYERNNEWYDDGHMEIERKLRVMKSAITTYEIIIEKMAKKPGIYVTITTTAAATMEKPPLDRINRIQRFAPEKKIIKCNMQASTPIIASPENKFGIGWLAKTAVVYHDWILFNNNFIKNEKFGHISVSGGGGRLGQHGTCVKCNFRPKNTLEFMSLFESTFESTVD